MLEATVGQLAFLFQCQVKGTARRRPSVAKGNSHKCQGQLLMRVQSKRETEKRDEGKVCKKGKRIEQGEDCRTEANDLSTTTA